MFGGKDIPFLGLILLIIAPMLSSLLQLGLSRTREYDADLGAFELTRDARGLASALMKLEKYHGGLMEKIVLPGRKQQQPSLLRTHPETEDRVERLLAPGKGRGGVYRPQLSPKSWKNRLKFSLQGCFIRLKHCPDGG